MKIEYCYSDAYNNYMDNIDKLIAQHENHLLNYLEESKHLSNKQKVAIFLEDNLRNKLYEIKFDYQCKAIPIRLEITEGE